MSFGNATLFTAVMLLAGVAIPVMATLLGGLARQLGSAPAAVGAIFATGMICAITVMLAMGPPDRAKLASVELPYLLGGVLIAFYALSITIIGPRFGMGNAIFCVLAGQIASAAIIDHYGLLGAPLVKMDAVRLLGILLMIGGLVLARKPA